MHQAGTVAETPVRVLHAGPALDGVLESHRDGCTLRNLRTTPDDDVAPVDRPVTYLTSGWADLHCHVFAGVGTTGLAAQRVGLAQGVHLLMDAGSAGAYTIDGFREFVIKPSTTPVLAWLNVSGIGLATVREFARRDWLDIPAGLKAFDHHHDILVGVKVRSCAVIVERLGLEPLEAALDLAAAVDRPVMVHIGEAPPTVSDILDRLRPGDVVTHCFHGKPGNPWHLDGQPLPALADAIDRGVLLDVGHGAASFDATVASRAIDHGRLPHTVSTDLHARNIHGPAYSMAHVIGRMLDAGMTIEHVVDAVTVTPRAAAGLPTPAPFREGPVQHGTVFTVTPAPRSPNGGTNVTVDAVIHDHAVAPGQATTPCHVTPTTMP